MSYVFFFNFYLLVLAENELKNHKINFDPWVSMFRLSASQCQANVFVMIFALVQRVVPLFCSGHWQLFPAAWGRLCWPVLGLSFLDVYGQMWEKYCGCYCQQNVLTYQLGFALHLGKSEISMGPPRDNGIECLHVKHKSL